MATAERDFAHELEYERNEHASILYRDMFIHPQPLTIRMIELFLQGCLDTSQDFVSNPYRPEHRLHLDDEKEELQLDLETLPKALKLDTREGRKVAIAFFERRAIRITKILQLEPLFITPVDQEVSNFTIEQVQLLRSKCWEAAGLLRMIQAGTFPKDLEDTK